MANSKIKAILLDIEGTVASIDFVHQVLFPLSASQMPDFIKNWQKNDIAEEYQKLAQTLAEQTQSDPAEISAGQITALLLDYIRLDRKDTWLKSIQGKIWKQAFETNETKAHLYADVAPKLKEWKNQGFTLAIFSSGSVAAQKLYFGHSISGDLNHLFSAYFDTTTGPKKEASTYHKIAGQLELQPAEILFLSDNVEELQAATTAGVKVVLVLRENLPGQTAWPQVRSLAEITAVFLGQ